MTEFIPREISAPKYRVLDKREEDDGTRNVYHVKLGQPHIARMLNAGDAASPFVEVEYVHITAVRKAVQDKEGQFVYNETSVTVSDEDGEAHQAYLFFAHRQLTLEETLFSIGEI